MTHPATEARYAAVTANTAVTPQYGPEPCAHHWAIEEPCGATSIGCCRKCGELREFRNWLDFKAWVSLTDAPTHPSDVGIVVSRGP